jgi:hypothetical protein
MLLLVSDKTDHAMILALVHVSRWRLDCVAGHVGLEVRRETGKE